MSILKASDLMLDDWIYAGERLKNVQVSRIYEHSICTKEGFWESEEVNEEDLRPILLTSNIFNHIKEQHIKEQLKNITLYGVRYVHELQHFLKNRGISLYINLESDYSKYENY